MGMVENIVGCKWSLTVLSLVRAGVHRPGAMEHAVEGLSAKVLNERLKETRALRDSDQEKLCGNSTAWSTG